MTVEELKKISIEDCEIIFPRKGRDPIYDNCKRQGVTSVGDLLSQYKTGAFVCQNKMTSLQLDGVVDLLNYKYCGEVSRQITTILSSSLDVKPSQPLFRSQDLSRLGLSSFQRRALSFYINKEGNKTVSAYFLAYHIEKVYTSLKKESSNILSSIELQYLLCKLDLLLTMFFSVSEAEKEVHDLERHLDLLLKRRKALDEEIISTKETIGLKKNQILYLKKGKN